MKIRYLIAIIAAAVLTAIYQISTRSEQKIRVTENSSMSVTQYDEKEIYYTKVIQPLLSNRCAVCHSCNNAPCQLNLTTYEGFTRGANKHFVYDFQDKASPMTRLGIDATLAVSWHRKNFFPIFDSKNPEASIISSLINMKSNSNDLPDDVSEEARSCPANQNELLTYIKEKPNAGMPFGLPMLSKDEKQTLTTWLSNGAVGPTWAKLQKNKIPSGVNEPRIRDWEKFLNDSTVKQKLISRYIYEHWFLAHLYFSNEPTTFYSLVRSKSECELDIDIIATRRPSNDPGDKFYYCFQKQTAQVVNKTHLPLELSSTKLLKLKSLFYMYDWSVSKLPSYDEKLSSNPFLTFHDIPAKIRYKFLLEDAQYHINTFIRGPVCFGNTALNSIDEQFYTFFINPDSDFASADPNFETQITPYMFLPSSYNGSNAKLLNIISTYGDMVKNREKYRKIIAKRYLKNLPKGYGLENLWAGDGVNDNAVLTVMRHKDSATVLKGLRGDLSKTVYVLDYPLFERLVYNLVVNYDVYGNLAHQAISRIYMDFIRMEAEENYLLFMPSGHERKVIRKHWYRGVFANLKMKYWYEHHNINAPTQMTYTDPKNAQAEFIEQFVFNRLNPIIRGPIDFINWKHIQAPSADYKSAESTLSEADITNNLELRKIASIKAKDKMFPVFFPDIAFLQIKSKDNNHKAYTIVHHREHYSLAFITNEDGRRDPQNDSLSVFPGFVGSFPNLFFSVNQDQLTEFVTAINNIHSQSDYSKIKLRWGISRTQSDFWTYSDWFYNKAQQLDPSNSGLFDLNRYDNNIPERKVNKYIAQVTEKAVNEDDEDRQNNTEYLENKN